jgi:hypothetical protein
MTFAIISLLILILNFFNSIYCNPSCKNTSGHDIDWWLILKFANNCDNCT